MAFDLKDNAKISILLLLCLVFFIGFALREGFADQDSYYWLAKLGIQENGFLFVKLIISALIFIILLVSWKTGEIYYKKNGWWVALILFSCTLFFTDFFKFENDLFGYALGFAGLYYALKCERRFDWTTFFKATILFIVGGLVWGGTIYWVLAASILVFPFVFLWIGAMLLGENLSVFYTFLNMPETVMEQVRQIGLIYFGPSIFALTGAMFTPKRIVLAFLLTCIPTFFMAKLYVLAIPFLIIIAAHFFWHFGAKQNKLELIEKTLIVFSFFVATLYFNNAPTIFPTSNDLTLIKDTAKMGFIQNNFTSGHILTYYGGNGSCILGGLCDYNYVGLVLDVKQKDLHGCEKIKETEHLMLLNCK